MSAWPLQPHGLAVDGSPAVLDLCRDLLAGVGYHVSLASYPDTDVAKVKRLGPDGIILDLVPGGRDTDWPFLQQLMGDRDTAGVPVIVCTGAIHLVRALADQLDEMGVSVELKPFDIDELLRAVGDALTRPGRRISPAMERSPASAGDHRCHGSVAR